MIRESACVNFITTLAAKAYENESTLIDALFNLVHRMPEHIEDRKDCGQTCGLGRESVNREEEFADRWESDDYQIGSNISDLVTASAN